MRPRTKFRHEKSSVIRAIGYVRVSSEQQRDNTSVDDQRTKLARECVRRGIDDFLILEDQGISGKSMDRQGLQEALRLLRSGERNLLLVTHLDRLARNTTDVLELADRCQREGWNMVALEGALTFDTSTAIGKLTLTVMAATAEFQRNQTREKILSAYEHKRQRGDGGLVSGAIDELIVAMYRDERLSMESIARRLNDEGVPTARAGRTVTSVSKKTGERRRIETSGKWTASTVWRVIQRAQQ